MPAKKEIMQPEINIGLFGHVDTGKTTLTHALSGKWTDTHSEELKRGITIRLGYADSVFRKCPKCKEPECYTVKEKCEVCKAKTVVLRKVSFIDAPGHESLMATMLAGATIIDGALLLISANETCPQPQTREHLMALDIMGVKNIVVVQNKIDLVEEKEAVKNYKEIKEFLKGTRYADSAIIPISAQHNINTDILIKTIEQSIPTPKRDLKKPVLMLVARSFDVNKPGIDPLKIVGGVLGGALIHGELKQGDEIKIKPGYKTEKEGRVIWQTVETTVVDIKSGGQSLKEIVPGGSMAVMTELDPSIVKSDAFVGSVVGHKGELPPVWNSLSLETHLLERVVGAKQELSVEPIKQKETLMLNVNSAATIGIVDKLEKGSFHCNLKLPVCADQGSRVTISRLIGARWRLIGYGVIKGE